MLYYTHRANSPSPIPHDPATITIPPAEWTTQNKPPAQEPDLKPLEALLGTPTPASPILNLALFTGISLFLLGYGLGLSELAFNWYPRTQKSKALRKKRLQELQDDQMRRKKEGAGREREGEREMIT